MGGLVAVLVLGSAVPAAADSLCAEPIAPASVDGSTATADQLKANLADVKTFIKQSDDFQDCLNREYVAALDDAKKNKKDPDPAWDTTRKNKIEANQALKEKVGAEYNAAAHAYMAKHPG
ncbi:MAG: hypothetical protein WDN03_11610 [Rhizomicrobium sp.]